MNALEKARLEIDKIDKEIISLYTKRMEEVKTVCQYKIENSIDVYQPKREKELLIKLDGYTKYEYKEDILKLYEVVLLMSKQHQQKIIDENNK